ncbi:S-adenosyl-L-methionine-dependent methyltransferase [Nemania sp. NC0429]|nr:S-adenosyl-L-methionine-dependent methyltransferase [Nemania sp. NC0429]
MAIESLYILNRAEDQLEEEIYRLETQHHLLDDMMNNEMLPPHIAGQIAAIPSPRVCEVATGSAIWLRKVAKTLPASAELVGLDLDTSKFPRPEALPPNIRLGSANAYEPFPEEFRGRFDVVYIRLFAFAARRGGGVALARNLASLLRPGGWLVWVEANMLIASAEPPSEALFECQKIQYAFMRDAGLEMGIPSIITSCIKEAGLRDCDERNYTCTSGMFSPQSSDWLARVHDQFIVVLSHTLISIFAKGGVDGLRSQQELDVLIAKLEEDMSGTRRPHALVVRAWGQKSL